MYRAMGGEERKGFGTNLNPGGWGLWVFNFSHRGTATKKPPRKLPSPQFFIGKLLSASYVSPETNKGKLNITPRRKKAKHISNGTHFTTR